MPKHHHLKPQTTKKKPSQPQPNIQQNSLENLDDIMRRAIDQPSQKTLTPSAVIQLQRMYGNQFVLGLTGRVPNSSSATGQVQLKRDNTVQRDGDDDLLSNDSSTGFDMSPLGPEPEKELTGNPFIDLPEPSPDETNKGPNPFDEMMKLDPKGQNPGLKTGRTGHTGKQGQLTDTAKVGYTGYSTGKNVDKFAKGIKSGNFDDQISDKEQSILAKALDATGSKLSQKLEVVGSDGAIAGDFLGALKDSQEMLDRIVEIASKGIPIISAVVSAGLAAKSAWDGWNTYSAWKGAAKEAVKVLAPNTDDTDDVKAPLLKDIGGKTSATYAQAKSLRALVSKIFGFATSVAKAIGQIAALFTGGLGNLVSLSASLISSMKTGGDWLKALYKIAMNTKGKNREKHANIVMEAADAGDQTMLNTLLKLDLTSDVWMIKLAAKLGTTYDPKTDGSGWFAKGKDKLVNKVSQKATNYAGKAKQLGKDLGQYSGKKPQWVSDKIKDQFIEGATAKTMEILLNKPKNTDEMHAYLQELKVVGMYNDYAKEVMSSMKSK